MEKKQLSDKEKILLLVNGMLGLGLFLALCLLVYKYTNKEKVENPTNIEQSSNQAEEALVEDSITTLVDSLNEDLILEDSVSLDVDVEPINSEKGSALSEFTDKGISPNIKALNNNKPLEVGIKSGGPSLGGANTESVISKDFKSSITPSSSLGGGLNPSFSTGTTPAFGSSTKSQFLKPTLGINKPSLSTDVSLSSPVEEVIENTDTNNTIKSAEIIEETIDGMKY